MLKKEKIPEALTAVIDNRITIKDNTAIVKSSDFTKSYTVIWKDNLFYSDDNATYWAGYVGYPIIAVLMKFGKLSYDAKFAKSFSKINWKELNKKNKNDYKKSIDDIVSTLDNKDEIYKYIDKVYDELEELDIKITRKKSEV